MHPQLLKQLDKNVGSSKYRRPLQHNRCWESCLLRTQSYSDHGPNQSDPQRLMGHQYVSKSHQCDLRSADLQWHSAVQETLDDRNPSHAYKNRGD